MSKANERLRELERAKDEALLQQIKLEEELMKLNGLLQIYQRQAHKAVIEYLQAKLESEK